MELRVGCRRPARGTRSPAWSATGWPARLVKGQPLGGTDDEWVVIEPVYRAVELAEQLHDDPPRRRPAASAGSASASATSGSANWVNCPAGQRLGLAPIPDGPVTLQACCAAPWPCEMAYRPGGVLAAKIHLKHVASPPPRAMPPARAAPRPSCWPRSTSTRADRNLDLVLAEFRNYQQGILPAGPGAREPHRVLRHASTPTSTTAPTAARRRSSAATATSSTC